MGGSPGAQVGKASLKAAKRINPSALALTHRQRANTIAAEGVEKCSARCSTSIGPAHNVNWHFFHMPVANVIVIALMVIVFVAAILIPFPRSAAMTPEEERMWTTWVRERAVRALPPEQAAAGPPAEPTSRRGSTCSAWRQSPP